MTWLFFALVCTSASNWSNGCTDVLEVRIERLSKTTCEKIRDSYLKNARVVQADCIDRGT